MVHTVTWAAGSALYHIPMAAGYNVYLNSTPPAGQWLQLNAKLLPGTTAAFPDTGIRLPGVQYRVTALYPDGSQGSTDFVYTNPPPLQVPGSFRAARAVRSGILIGQDVRLSWSQVTGAKGYRLFGTGQPPGETLLAASPQSSQGGAGPTPTWEAYLSNLPTGTYNWQLTADYGGAWQTAGLPAASVTVFDLCAPPQPTAGPAPDSVYVSGQGGSGPPPTPPAVTLTWTRVAGAVAYTVEREDALRFGPVTTLGTTCTNPQSFTFWYPKPTAMPSGQVLYVNQGANRLILRDSGPLVAGSTYRYRVTAFGPAGQKGWKASAWKVQ